MKTNQSRNFLFLMFGVLYFVQGVIQAYQLNFFKPHMSSEGIDADQIGLVASLALLPFIIKAIFGLISDRVNLFGYGHRVPYMVVGVVSCAVAFFIAYFIDPSTNYGLLAAVVVMASFFMALFDTTADALAVEVTAPEDQSRVQSYMTTGRAAGLIILSFVFGRIADSFGFSAIFLVISVCLLIPLFMLFRVREADTKVKSDFTWKAFAAFKQPAVLLFSLFLIVSWTSFQGVDGLVTFYMSDDLGISTTQIGNYGTLKGVGMVLGAIGAGLIIKNFGRKPAAMVTLAAVTLGGFIFSGTSGLTALLVMGVLWGIVVGLHWTVYATIAMSITDIRVAGSMFAIIQTMSNIGLAIGDGLTASLTDNYAFGTIFRIFAVVNLIAIPILLLFFSRFATMQKANFAADAA